MGSRSSSTKNTKKSVPKVKASSNSSVTSKRQAKTVVVEEEEGDDDEEEEEEEEFEVETIVTHKKTRQGSLLFLLKWKNYPDSDNTWEAQEDLNCHELVQQYLQDHHIDSQGNSTKPASAATTSRPKRPATSGPPPSIKKVKTETKPSGPQKKQPQQAVPITKEEEEEDGLEPVAKLDMRLKSWENTLLIETIGMADDLSGGQEPIASDRNQLTVFGIDSSGNRVAELLKDVRVKAPQRLLDFLLDHLKFRS